MGRILKNLERLPWPARLRKRGCHKLRVNLILDRVSFQKRRHLFKGAEPEQADSKQMLELFIARFLRKACFQNARCFLVKS